MKKRGISQSSKVRHQVAAKGVRLTSLPKVGRRDVLIAVLLALNTLAIYGQVITHQFITFDVDLYVWDNPVVMGGVTLQGIRWAFTTFHSANWHPVTWLSHMIDSQLFGLWAGGH